MVVCGKVARWHVSLMCSKWSGDGSLLYLEQRPGWEVHVLLRAHITVHHTRQVHKAHIDDPRKRPNKGVLLMVLNKGVS